MGCTTWAGLATARSASCRYFLPAFVDKNMHRIDLRNGPAFSFAVFAAVALWNSTFNADVGCWQKQSRAAGRLWLWQPAGKGHRIGVRATMARQE